MTSATDKRAITARNKQIAKDRETDREVIQSLMAHVNGRRWVWRQLELAQVFVGNENLDPQYMAFEKGRRNEGLRLLALVTRHAPDAYIRMTTENTGVELDTTNPSEDPGDGRTEPDAE